MWTVNYQEFVISEVLKLEKIAHWIILTVLRMKVISQCIFPQRCVALIWDTFCVIIVFFIDLLVFQITGCGTPELFHDDEDVIDLKVEPLEVSEYI